MVKPRSLDLDAVLHRHASVFDTVEAALGAHLIEIDGKIGRRHLFGHDLLQAAGAVGRVKEELTLGAFVERAEERHALNVVPVKVGDEDVGREGLLAELALQFVAEAAKAGATIENIDLVAE